MNDDMLNKKINNICKQDINIPQSFTNTIKDGLYKQDNKEWRFSKMEMKRVAAFLFTICIITATSLGAYVYISQNTKPEEVVLSDLIPKELDYEATPVNQSQAEERAKDFLNKLGLEYDAITETELLGTDMISFWYISFDNCKYWIQINSRTGAIYNLSTSFIIMGEDIDSSYTEEYESLYNGVDSAVDEFLSTTTKKTGRYEERIPYGKDIIVLVLYDGNLVSRDIEYYQYYSDKEAEEYAKEIFMKIPLEENPYTIKMRFERGEWIAQLKTKIDGFETRYKEVILRFKDRTKQIVGIELNTEDIYDNNEIVINKEDVQQLMDDYISNIKSNNTFEVKDIRLGISYVDPHAVNSFNRDYLMTEDEIVEIEKEGLKRQLLLEQKLNDGDTKSPFEKWAEIYGNDKTFMFFGGNVFRKVWYVDIKTQEDPGMGGIYNFTIGIDATNKMIVYYEPTDKVDIFEQKPAKRTGGMAI